MEPDSPQTLSDDDRKQLRELETKINAILPPRYVGCFESVLPNSMSSAKLKVDSEGRIVWGEIWTTFCHLALAGGPPHRGTLLQPVSRAEAEAKSTEQQAVVAELQRAIHLTTELKAVLSPIPGWVAVRCYDEDMAAWLVRAMVAENVIARRNRSVLLVPAGPNFRPEKEIKNVVVSLAKACHYLLDHTEPGQRPTGIARSLVEPALPEEITASPADYLAAVDRIDQGIRKQTGMQTVLDNAPGWIGAKCAGEEMAVAMLRAVIVEDVLARIEGEILFVPVSLKQRDTDKVIAVVAQSHRLWRIAQAVRD